MSHFDKLSVTKDFKLIVSLSLSKTDKRIFEILKKLNVTLRQAQCDIGFKI